MEPSLIKPEGLNLSKSMTPAVAINRFGGGGGDHMHDSHIHSLSC